MAGRTSLRLLGLLAVGVTLARAAPPPIPQLEEIDADEGSGEESGEEPALKRTDGAEIAEMGKNSSAEIPLLIPDEIIDLDASIEGSGEEPSNSTEEAPIAAPMEPDMIPLDSSQSESSESESNMLKGVPDGSSEEEGSKGEVSEEEKEEDEEENAAVVDGAAFGSETNEAPKVDASKTEETPKIDAPMTEDAEKIQAPNTEEVPMTEEAPKMEAAGKNAEEEKEEEKKDAEPKSSEVDEDGTMKRIDACLPGPCCDLDTSRVYPEAWKLPNRVDPNDMLARPKGNSSYPANTTLIVKLWQCFPLAITGKDGSCVEFKDGGMHLFRCAAGSFRHAFYKDFQIRSLACGQCRGVPRPKAGF